MSQRRCLQPLFSCGCGSTSPTHPPPTCLPADSLALRITLGPHLLPSTHTVLVKPSLQVLPTPAVVQDEITYQVSADWAQAPTEHAEAAAVVTLAEAPSTLYVTPTTPAPPPARYAPPTEQSLVTGWCRQRITLLMLFGEHQLWSRVPFPWQCALWEACTRRTLTSFSALGSSSIVEDKRAQAQGCICKLVV